MAVETGARESELFGLTWDRVDLEDGVIEISSQRTRTNRGTIVEGAPKSNRRVYVTEHAGAALKGWRRRLLEERVELDPAWSEHDLVWPSKVGTPLGHRNLLRHLHRACEKAKIRRVSFHTLRHSAATFLLAAGVDSRVIMDVLGHADPRMVGRYQHVVDDVRRDAATKLEAARRGGAGSQVGSEVGSNDEPRIREVPDPGS